MQRIVVRCDTIDYPFYISIRGTKNTFVMLLKDFKGLHNTVLGRYVR